MHMLRHLQAVDFRLMKSWTDDLGLKDGLHTRPDGHTRHFRCPWSISPDPSFAKSAESEQIYAQRPCCRVNWLADTIWKFTYGEAQEFWWKQGLGFPGRPRRLLSNPG
jgi:hypothetical protein